MVARYHVNEVDRPKVVGEIVDILDLLARDGALLMLERALSAEVDEFLGRERYVRGDEFGGYRNGYGRSPHVGDRDLGSAGESAEGLRRAPGDAGLRVRHPSEAEAT